ncbi:uncharacterized protein LOC126555352 [Aphis gossypii]|uniref:uncharacterized protein LOC126555352 n=1 Tax=Aphis gossypii TaxID=80765 RepID=UPI00215901F3|nr:uncharacterized protein LOC126555352 [Aphis gossypii]
MTAKVTTSPNLNTGSNSLPTTSLSKPNTDTHSRQPAIQSTTTLSSSTKSKFIVGSHKSVSSKLSSVPVRKHIDIFVSRLEPCVTTTMLESELFNSYSDVTINKLVTKHPSYSSFHVRLPAEKLDDVLEPTFWPDGAVEKHIQVDVIYTDFTKAFDRVDHGRLIETLYKTGFGEPLLSWFKSYLSDRVQWVKVFGCKSSISKVSSGVPQGGHLSPILFSLYVNGIKEMVENCELLMFADDLKLFRKIENLSDCSMLKMISTT